MSDPTSEVAGFLMVCLMALFVAEVLFPPKHEVNVVRLVVALLAWLVAMMLLMWVTMGN